MISAKCDELRAMAESVGLAMPQAATLMMGAADIIEGLEAENARLREVVSDGEESARLILDESMALESENAKLRERIAELEELLPDSGRWFSAETVEAYVAEIAKLRELVEYMHRCYVSGHDWGPYGAPEKRWVEEQMRELGIEVPDD